MGIIDDLNNIDDILDQSAIDDGEIELPDDRPVPVKFITGSAGTGKSFQMAERVRQDPKYGVLTATTGVAAVNLGSITINSLLKYYDTESLQDKYMSSGGLARALADLVREGYHNLIIDEVSMMDANQLDLIYLSAKDVASYRTLKRPLGLILLGDFCQLPPVNAKWVFEADCWPEFEHNTERLEKVWRQTDPQFLSALTLARRGDPYAAVALKKASVEFSNRLDSDFAGTTIVPKNADIERYNYVALTKVKGRDLVIKSHRWGMQRPEWVWDRVRGTGIPNAARLRVNALVMILANDAPAFTYANGDLGYIVDYKDGMFLIKLLRTGNVVQVGIIERLYTQKEAPPEMSTPGDWLEAAELEATNRPLDLPYYLPSLGRWVVGAIRYYPLRLGYAITVHKSQGLTLDRVQIDARGHFFGQPNMAYVGLSRARTPEGLRIVGGPDLLARRINVAPEVVRWL